MQRFIFLYITFAFLILSNFCNAKNYNPDSLLYVLHTVKQPSEQIIILNMLANAQLKSDPLLAYNYAEQALFLSESINNISGKANSKLNLALFYNENNESQKALNLLLEARGEFLKISDDLGLAKTDLELGKVYQGKFEYEKALDVLYQAKDLFKELKKDKELAETNNFIGGSYYDQENYDKAFEYFQNSLVIWEKTWQ
ncbi:MAG: tetratricopeptide repeat protein [Bacteroidales bacterium]